MKRAHPPEAPQTHKSVNWLEIGLLSIVAVGLVVVAAMSLGDRLFLNALDTSSLLVIFFTGLTTGGLTCLAVQGGLLATTIAQREGEAYSGRAAPIVLFLAAKLVAYTLVGALLGWFGGAIGLTPTIQGWLQVAIGLFMLGVALQMLNVHPIFRHFSVQPPRFVTRWIRRESRSSSLLAPVVLGALTVFMPCATTQAMMLAAVASGSAAAGATIMFAFILGTTPLFFSLGYLATRLNAALQGWFTRLAAVAIILLAIVSIAAGLSVLGAPVPDLAAFTARPIAAATTGSVQEIVVRADPTAYVPNRVVFKVGQPARLRLMTGDRLGCTSSFMIPALGYHKILAKNQQAVFDIPTDKPGKIPFICSMGMYRGVIEVEA